MFRLEKFAKRTKIERQNGSTATTGCFSEPQRANVQAERVTSLEHAVDEKWRALAIVLRCEAKRSVLAWEEIRWRL
jgi:hypothetical protein